MNPGGRKPLHRTIRTEGAPSEPAVASAIALGASSTAAASAYHFRNCSSGSEARSARRSSASSSTLELCPQLGRPQDLGAQLVFARHQVPHDTQDDFGIVAERAEDLVPL